MKRNVQALAAAAITIGLVASGCSSDEKDTTSEGSGASASSTGMQTSSSAPATSTTSPSTGAQPSTGSAPPAADLPSLVPPPAGTQRTDGPDNISDNGIHLHFLVTGAPTEVMNTYKSALEGKGWSVTIENSSGGGGGGGATLTGTNGGAYGVFTGGGYGNTTDVNACAWQAKPANTHCGGH